MAFTILTQGSFTSAGLAVKINLPSSADYFRVQNLTQAATTQATGRGVTFEWYGNNLTAPGAQTRWFKTNASTALNMTVDSTGGFTYVVAQPQPELAVTGTAITNATPAVVSMTNTYSNGDVVRLVGTTGMQQIAGMDFTISSVSGAGFTLLGLPAAGFAAPATAVVARRISNMAAVEPAFLYVTNISQAGSAVVTVSRAHSYLVGMKVHFSVPATYGMVEMNELEGVITAVGTYTITVNINSSGFTAFSFPTSALSPTSPAFATIAPAGQAPGFYNVSYAPFHSGNFIPYMYLPAGVQSPAGSTGDVIVWQAYKMETTFYT